jgi:hypothetical protein
MKLESRILRLEHVRGSGRMIIVGAGPGQRAVVLREHGIAPCPIDLVVTVNKPEPIRSWIRIDSTQVERMSA